MKAHVAVTVASESQLLKPTITVRANIVLNVGYIESNIAVGAELPD